MATWGRRRHVSINITLQFMVQDQWGWFFPFKNIRIFENRLSKNDLCRVEKYFQAKYCGFYP